MDTTTTVNDEHEIKSKRQQIEEIIQRRRDMKSIIEDRTSCIKKNLQSAGFRVACHNDSETALVFFCPFKQGAIGFVDHHLYDRDDSYCKIELGPSGYGGETAQSGYWPKDYGFLYYGNPDGGYPCQYFKTEEEFVKCIQSYKEYVEMNKTRDCPGHKRGVVYSDCDHAFAGTAKISLRDSDGNFVKFGRVTIKRTIGSKITLSIRNIELANLKDFFVVDQVDVNMYNGIKKTSKMKKTKGTKPKLFLRRRILE